MSPIYGGQYEVWGFPSSAHCSVTPTTLAKVNQNLSVVKVIAWSELPLCQQNAETNAGARSSYAREG